MLYAVFVGQTVIQAVTAKSSDSYPVSNVLSGLAVCLFSVCMNLLGDIWNLTSISSEHRIQPPRVYI
jgi:hypothetical protein